MQSAPAILQRALWSAFKASKPISVLRRRHLQQLSIAELTCRPRTATCLLSLRQLRPYSDTKSAETESKVADAKQRINDTIDSRVDTVINLPGAVEDTVKKPQDETIIHTLPESSSIVYQSDATAESAAKAQTTDHAEDLTQASHDATRPRDHSAFDEEKGHRAAPSSRPLPSQLAAQYSNIRERFTDFMDNFQTHIFTASKRLNDLTGYSSIEQLKRDIEGQEQTVRQARQQVKDARTSYQNAISTRSDTQREVNDLLHRKHAWTPTDLERFTSLYRSDHANEQAEQKAHADLATAESNYEEASTKLSKSILARYHEEQVWSDKIRQMSTWGTWGLMGLNVLLFVVFQILVEPWRRRRLVKGFEEKVQEALKEQTAENEIRTLFHINKAQEMGAVENVTTPEPDLVEAQIPVEDITQRALIEEVIESVAETELATDAAIMQRVNGETEEMDPSSQAVTAGVEQSTNAETDRALSAGYVEESSGHENSDLSFRLGAHARAYLTLFSQKLATLLDERDTVSLTRRELSAKVLEGAFVGAVGVVCFFWATGISSSR